MSRIYFHSQEGDAEVLGSERAHAGVYCTDLCSAVLRLNDPFVSDQYISRLRTLLPPDSYVLREHEPHVFMRTLSTYLAVSGERTLRVPETEGQSEAVAIETWYLALNTAIAAGSNPVRLMTKMHAQCEIHGYVEGPNRAWLADIIDAGLETHILREKRGDIPTGWRDVITVLRSRDDGPVVTSYSVTDQFPNRYAAGWEHDPDDDDDWYRLPAPERWDLAIKGLRSGTMGDGMEWKPETWGVGFGPYPTYSAFTLVSYLTAE